LRLLICECVAGRLLTLPASLAPAGDKMWAALVKNVAAAGDMTALHG
jgi:hypothetical protein